MVGPHKNSMQDDIVEKRELLKKKFQQMQQPLINQSAAKQQSHSNIGIIQEQHCWAGKSFSDLLFIGIFCRFSSIQLSYA